jgi:voltage-gated potassium channel Kch
VPDDALDDIGITVEYAADEVDDVADELDHMGRHVFEILRADIVSREGYLIVLIMVLLTIVVIPIGDDFTGGQILSATMLALLVLTTLSRSHVSHALRVAGFFVTVGAVLAATLIVITGKTAEIGAVNPSPKWVFVLGAASYTLVLALCFPAILRQAFTHRQISLNTVAAALSAYLLLGLIFAYSYRLIFVINPPFFNQGHTNSFTYIYFSYVTLTTVGYGDFTPANDAGRAVAILEALFGQVFLVTIVALAVSHLGRSHAPTLAAVRQRSSTSGASPDADEADDAGGAATVTDAGDDPAGAVRPPEATK